ncbi:DUF192 domain-containing protein [Elusimicrobium minutum]|nr:DUF192 domain-containing protein [Elusimicrobium minutum]
MKRMFVLTLIFIMFACLGEYKTVEVKFPNGKIIKAEIADTPALTEKGLMYRKELAEDKGMLFAFGEEDVRVFWMKNTFIDLDMVFLDSDKKVKCVHSNVSKSTPFTLDSDVAVAFCENSKYVLEVNAGIAAKNNLQPGQKLEF